MMPTGFGGGKGVIILLFILLGLWLMTGIYRVNPQEQGVVMRFGEWNDDTTKERTKIR